MSCKATRRIGYALDDVNFFVAMQASFGVFVTVYLVRSHWAAQDIGFALAISTVASLCSQIPAGALIDARFGSASSVSAPPDNRYPRRWPVGAVWRCAAAPRSGFLSPGRLAIEQKPEPFVMAEAVGLAVGGEFGEGLGHATHSAASHAQAGRPDHIGNARGF